MRSMPPRGAAVGARTHGAGAPGPQSVGPTDEEAGLEGQYVQVGQRYTDPSGHPEDQIAALMDVPVEAESLSNFRKCA